MRVKYFQDIPLERHDVFEAPSEAVTSHSPGQLRHALYDVGDEYRRNM